MNALQRKIADFLQDKIADVDEIVAEIGADYDEVSDTLWQMVFDGLIFSGQDDPDGHTVYTADERARRVG